MNVDFTEFEEMNIVSEPIDREFEVWFKDVLTPEIWKLVWDNPKSPFLVRELISNPLDMKQTREIIFYNNGDVKLGGFLCFFRDIAKGRKERVVIWKNTWKETLRNKDFGVEIRRNVKSHFYDDWETIKTGDFTEID